ncbi:MAG: HAMP domain-containing histidine kinase [Clostridia bacterium]|nr:HAMP domain-containing histidine kinase [Clostridia bacterium]
MIKKLKIKLIVHNMLLIGLVMIGIFASLCVMTYFIEEGKITAVLEENLLFYENRPQLPSSKPQESDNKVYLHSFTILINNEGEIIAETENEMPDDMLKKAIPLILETEYERGNIRSLNLSFLKTNTPRGMLISFLSREHLVERMRENTSHAFLATFVGLLVFLYISKRLADIAIAPVEEAWNQQKQFLADASHDLKTPLTVILANNNILSAHKDETVESQMKWIESTSEEAGRMSDLINKMLELAKGEAAREDIRLGDANISELVENSILQFEVVAFEKSITIDSGIQPDIFARTHAPTLSKVLEILFDNAIKYSSESGKISVTLYKSSKKIYFSINNKGEYIKPDELPHVFERFYRSNKERKVGGHGLGLSLAKKKCDLLGHKISVESNEEDGTTFTIIIKARK